MRKAELCALEAARCSGAKRPKSRTRATGQALLLRMFLFARTKAPLEKRRVQKRVSPWQASEAARTWDHASRGNREAVPVSPLCLCLTFLLPRNLFFASLSPRGSVPCPSSLPLSAGAELAGTSWSLPEANAGSQGRVAGGRSLAQEPLWTHSAVTVGDIAFCERGSLALTGPLTSAGQACPTRGPQVAQHKFTRFPKTLHK